MPRLSLFCVLITLVLMFSGCSDAAEMPEGETIVTSGMTTGAETTAAETTATPQVAAVSSDYSIITATCKDADEVKRSLLSTLSGLKSMTPDDVAVKASTTVDYDFEEYYTEAYINTKINEMTEFLFPTAEIDGYTMISAKISGIRSVIYYYGPTEKVESEDGYLFDSSDGILIGIKHPDNVDRDDPLAAPIRQTWGKDYILRDDMLQVVGWNEITAVVQNTIFRMSVPDSMNDPDTLFDLAEKLRDSMELVQLD